MQHQQSEGARAFVRRVSLSQMAEKLQSMHTDRSTEAGVCVCADNLPTTDMTAAAAAAGGGGGAVT